MYYVVQEINHTTNLFYIISRLSFLMIFTFISFGYSISRLFAKGRRDRGKQR